MFHMKKTLTILDLFYSFQQTDECKYVECVPGQWTDWSSKCGLAERMREIVAVERTTMQFNCDGLKRECDNTIETQERDQICE